MGNSNLSGFVVRLSDGRKIWVEEELHPPRFFAVGEDDPDKTWQGRPCEYAGMGPLKQTFRVGEIIGFV